MPIKLKLYALLFSCLFSATAMSQVDSIALFISKNQDINKKSMLALGTWSIANAGYSLSKIDRSVPPTQQEYFHEMNVAWSGVNLVIAAIFYTKNRREVTDKSFTNAVALNATSKKSFSTNVLLDGVYIGLGIGLKKIAQQSNGQRQYMQAGFGNAIAYQGAFLLAFDAIMYAVHQSHGKALADLSRHVSIYPNAIIWRI